MAKLRRTPWLTGQGVTVLLLVWLLSLGYAVSVAKRGWIPNDEGLLAQCAERVLQGQVPHRDFQDTYTGGLSYLHALAFRALGTNLWSLRLALLCGFTVWVPVVYWIASRFTGPLGAGLATLVAVAWSIPNYPASMPSWYNLFFATFGVAAILGFIEGGSGWWLAASGFSAGCSFLIKISGLYFAAAALLFFLFREQSRPGQGSDGEVRSSFRLFATCALLGFAAVAVFVLRRRLGMTEIYHFLLPAVALVAVLLRKERTVAKQDGRWSDFSRMLVPFAAGWLLAVVPLLAAYWSMGALSQLLVGTFVLPAKRLSSIGRSPGPIAGAGPLLLLVCFVSLVCHARSRTMRAALNVSLAALLAALLLACFGSERVFAMLWYSIAAAIPLAVCFALSVTVPRQKDTAAQQRTMLLVAVVALCSWIQFPFSNAAYYCYVAPLLVLTLLPLLPRTRQSRASLCMLCAFAIAFPVLRLRPVLERDQFSSAPLVKLQLPRAGGLLARADQARVYEQLVSTIQQHARPGDFIYAGPDAPEAYFLAGMKNPTALLYDIFEDPRARNQEVLRAAKIPSLRVAVINTTNSPDNLPAAVTAELQSRFPNSTWVGPFQVRWR